MAARKPVARRPPPPPPSAPSPTVIVLQQQQQQSREGAHGFELGVVLAALFFTLLQFVCFMNAFGALDRAAPDTASAEGWAWATVLVGVAAVGLAAWAAYLRDARPLPAAIGGVFGLLIGGILAPGIQESFNDVLKGAGFVLTELILLGILLIPFIVFLVLIFGDHRRTGWGLGFGMILFHALVYVVVGMYIVSNLESLAEASRQAHARSPAWGLVGVLGVLAATALAVRRRRGVT